MSETGPGETFQWLAENWTARLADALEGMTGERPQTSWQASSAPSWTGEALWWEQPLSLHQNAVFWIGAPEEAWVEIGSQILRGAGIEVTGQQDARNTYLEIVSQACSGLAQAIGRRVKAEVTCESGAERDGAPADALAFEIGVTMGGVKIPSLCLCFHPGLSELSQTEVARVPAVQAPLSKIAPQPEPERPALDKTPPTLDVLMEVDLPVSVSFGRAQLPLKDVLKLSVGSIVELNRTLNEPVEVIVNNCVVARGEVVVVEGNYGVRIQEIISREKRLRTLN
ncbi:MAG TPA: flagellar motor switch protein FliN [Bryobacteraceae bacterium]|nr:flagellar motor switch protein FliN [Bryobacteraceae bacterium]HOL72524.1 flagellar motor switch protein FliN [Bryobacteraceae bacterium]HOQ44186.1 flagellar motor switch protein FliN [Bryobacteraceae bacterium]HPQ14673.1 flagellar motor switch protein FliN [Bryobacteraceae bacterium]HPU70504.1 flagellar motor switch protein FliN [Bryobacteraceae bacterium]